MDRVGSISMLEIMWCYRQYSGQSLARLTVVKCGGIKYVFLIGQSHLRFKSQVSESSLRVNQEKGLKDKAASTDFAYLCFLKLDAYFPSIPCTFYFLLGRLVRWTSSDKLFTYIKQCARQFHIFWYQSHGRRWKKSYEWKTVQIMSFTGVKLCRLRELFRLKIWDQRRQITDSLDL